MAEASDMVKVRGRRGRAKLFARFKEGDGWWGWWYPSMSSKDGKYFIPVREEDIKE